MKFTRKIGFLSLAALVSLTIQSCSDDILDVDISKSKYQLESIHLDSIVKHTPEEGLGEELFKLSQKFPEIIDYQFYYCYKTGLPQDTSFQANWFDFTINPYYKRLSERIDEKFPNTTRSKKVIEDGFKRIQVHLPKARLPKTMIPAAHAAQVEERDRGWTGTLSGRKNGCY